MKIIKGGVTAPKGFLAGSTGCGIKKSKTEDLSLLFSKVPGLCVGMFTTNKVKSGSLVLSMKRSQKGVAQAVIVNSGNANCCVGAKEIKDAEKITDLLGRSLRLDRNLVLICSTGIIGRPLPLNKILGGINNLIKDLKASHGTRFAKAIMTTDTVHKEIAVEINIGGKAVRIGGSVKGAGMICPDMATMLAFFTTDALVEKSALRQAFKEAVVESFNKITIDADMSTNDTALIFANGLAGNPEIKKGSSGYNTFSEALKFTAKALARKIVLDGEGAAKFIDINVKGAANKDIAQKIAKHIALSSLVKTMIAGGDPNWGRIAASVGSSGVNVNQKKIDIYLGKYLVMKDGAGADAPKELLSNIFKKKEIEIIVDLKSGGASSCVWTCDLTEAYVRINAEYET